MNPAQLSEDGWQDLLDELRMLVIRQRRLDETTSLIGRKDVRVTSYGLFWRESEIDWHPGTGYKDSFRLLGRIGANRGNIRMADFRQQQGIYILYDDYGPSYVGLTRGQGLGQRIKDHKTDRHKGKWSRFSWFGFRPLLAQTSAKGLTQLGDPQTDVSEDTHTTIGDLEALLIQIIGPKANIAKMKFDKAEQWTQVDWDDIDTYMGRLSS